MIGTGKYDFPGIRKAGSAALRALIAGTSWGATVVGGPFKKSVGLVLEWSSEWLANNGLVVLNVGAIYVNGELNQKALDTALDDGLAKVKTPGLTDDQKKVIDDEVKKAFRKAVYYSASK